MTHRPPRLPVAGHDLALVPRLADRLDIPGVELVLALVKVEHGIEHPLLLVGLAGSQLGRVIEPRIAGRDDILPFPAFAHESFVAEAVEGPVSPGGQELLLAAVLVLEPLEELLAGPLAKRRNLLELVHRPEEQGAVFVEQLDDRNGRILGIRLARIRILVFEEVDDLADLEILQLTGQEDRSVACLDARASASPQFAELVHEGHGFAVGRAELDSERAGELRVDPLLLELRDEVVHAVELFLVELGKALVRLYPRPAGAVGVLVQPHRVDAVVGIEEGPVFGELLLRRTAGIADVQAPELDGLAVVDEFVLVAQDPPVLSGRGVGPFGHAHCRARLPLGLPLIPVLDFGFGGLFLPRCLRDTEHQTRNNPNQNKNAFQIAHSKLLIRSVTLFYSTEPADSCPAENLPARNARTHIQASDPTRLRRA